MGMTAFEIFGLLKLDTSEFNKGLDSAKSGIMGMVGGGLATAAKVGMAAVGAASTAIVGLGKTSIDAASSYQSAFTGVRKTVDATEEEYAELSSWIMEASTQMASSKEDIAATMEIAGQLGIRGVEGLEQFTQTMIMLGDSTNLSSEEAASALAKFMNITGDSAENAAAMGSVIVDLGNHFATTESDIVNMSTRLASAGAIAGLTGPEIMALSTAMSSVGINAEAGGTAMAQTLQKMSRAVANGGDKLKLYAQVAGMTAEQFATTWKDKPLAAVQAFIEGLGALNEADENTTLILDDLGLKGIREVNMLNALALSSGVLTDAVNTANQAYKEQNALQNEAEKRYQTTESQAMQTAEAFKNLKVAIGEELLPMYGNLMSFSSAAMNEMTRAFKEEGLTGLMESLGTAVSTGLASLNEKLPAIVDAGMSLLGALGKGIMDNADSIIDTGIEIAGKLIDGLSESTDEVSAGAVTIINTLAEKLLTEENVKKVSDTAFNIIIGFATALSNADTATHLVDGAVNIISGLCQSLIENAGPLAAAAIELIVALTDALINEAYRVAEAGPEIVDSLRKGILNAEDAFDKLGSDTINKFIDIIQKFLPDLWGVGGNMVINVAQGGAKEIKSLKELGEQSTDEFGKGVQEKTAEKAHQWGGHLIESFAYGISSKFGLLGSAAASAARIVSSYLHHSHPDVGPLADDYTWMPDMMDMFVEGIESKSGKLNDALTEAVSFQKPSLEYAGYGMVESDVGSDEYSEDDEAGSSGGYDGIVTAITDALMDMQLIVNIGNRPIEAMITGAQQRANYRNGGR